MSLYETLVPPGASTPTSTAAMAEMVPPGHSTAECGASDVDAKKRPLSVSSTSSSSSSSLPRQPKKKVAAGTTIEEWGDDTLNDLHDNLHSDKDGDHSMDNSDNVHEIPSQSSILASGATLLERVVAEILETEKKYVLDMKDIIEGYLQFILPRRDHLHIPAEDIMSLFGNIEDIYQFNSKFLSLLQECGTDPIQVAQCFVQQGQAFLVYADYCTNYPRAVEVLTKCMREPRIADAFKHQQMALQHGLPLGSYLLKPVQRILKYHLLLQNMLNNYDPTKDGHHVIQRALQSMTKMADTINEMKRKHERMVHIQEIQSMMYGWEGDDLTTFGDLVIEDSFRMYGAKAHRHFFLFEKGLFIAKKKEDGTLQLKDTILCSNLMLIESIPKEPLSFHVIPFNNPRLQYTVQAKNLDQKRLWCQELKHLILENYSAAIPEKAKELVMMLGKSKDEEGLDSSRIENVDPAKKQHNAPEYLERRRGRRKSTSLIPDFGLLKSKKGTRKSPRLRRRSDISNFSAQTHKSPSKSRLCEMAFQENHLEEEESSINELDEVDGAIEILPVDRVPLREHRNQNRMLRSQSRSLESLQEALAQSNGGDLNRNRDSGAKGYDDASYRARRLSQVLNDQATAVSTGYDHENNVITPGATPTNAQPPDEGTDRVDSVVVTRLRKKYIKQASAPASALLDTDLSLDNRSVHGSPNISSTDLSPSGLQEKDDGYVNVVFRGNSGFGVVQEEASSSVYSNVIRIHKAIEPEPPIAQEDVVDDSYGNYVKLDLTASTTGLATVLPDVVPTQCVSDSQGVRGKLHSNNEVSSQSPKPINKHCQRSVPFVCHSARSGQNSRLSDSTCDGACSSEKHDESQPNSPIPRRGNVTGVDSLLSSCASLATLKSNVPAVRDNSYMEGARTLSTQVLCDSSIPCKRDPWVPRSPEPSETNSNVSSPRVGRAHCPNQVTEQSVNKKDKSKTKKSKKDKKTLPQSKSFTSADDLKKQCIQREEDIYVKGHHRNTSDTLVFANRRAFLASAAGSDITQHQGLQRRIAHLATPPREMGPEDLVQEIAECRERGRVVARYATPPRQVMDPVLMKKYSTALVPSHLDLDQTVGYSRTSMSPTATTLPSGLMMSCKGCHSPQLSPSVSRRPGSAMSYDVLSPRDFSPESASTPHSPTRFNSHRPGSFHGTSVHSTRGNRALFSPQSPCSPTSNESIVDSLKSVVLNITSKITGRGHGPTSPKSVDSSPARTPRTRSAEDMYRIDRPHTPDSRSPSKHGKDKEKRKDKKHRFVYQLARAYSERVKGKSRQFLQRREHDSSVKKELKELLRENKPGSLTLGERIATSKPIVLGSYTLPRHRPPRPQRTPSSQESTSPDKVSSEQEVDGATSSTMDDNIHGDGGEMDTSPDSDVEKLEGAMGDVSSDFENLILSSELLSMLNTAPDTLEHSGSEAAEDCMSEFFYEQRFVEDLEGSLQMSTGSHSNVCDSAMYSDDGVMSYVDTDASPCLRMSIKDTVKLIENRHRSKPVPRIEIKQTEKAYGIQHILKSLEAAHTSSAPGSPVLSPEGLSSTSDLSFKTVRERTRELVECATLTRIRQNSYSISDDYKLDADEETRSKSEGSSPTKKGLDFRCS